MRVCACVSGVGGVSVGEGGRGLGLDVSAGEGHVCVGESRESREHFHR